MLPLHTQCDLINVFVVSVVARRTGSCPGRSHRCRRGRALRREQLLQVILLLSTALYLRLLSCLPNPVLHQEADAAILRLIGR